MRLQGMYHASFGFHGGLRLIQGGQKQNQKGHIIIQGHAADQTMPISQCLAQTTVTTAISFFFLRSQFVNIGNNIAEHVITHSIIFLYCSHPGSGITFLSYHGGLSAPWSPERRTTPDRQPGPANYPCSSLTFGYASQHLSAAPGHFYPTFS